jgi:hypothetical protein
VVNRQRGVTCGVGDRQERGQSVEAGLNARGCQGRTGGAPEGEGAGHGPVIWRGYRRGMRECVLAGALAARRRQESC